MGMAATVALVIGGALLGHALWMAWTFEAMLFGAAMAVVMTRSCAGANLYHARRRGERAGAISTGMSKA
jgi:predicted small integral membrane protein